MNQSALYAVQRYGLKNFLKNAFSIAISDVAVVSFQKSGRTWLRLMFGKVLEQQHNLKKIRLDTEYMTLFNSLPNILFSHGGCTKNHNKLSFQKIFRNKKVVLLVRDPRAVMVSLYHDHTKRNHWFSGNHADFIRSEWGLQKVMGFMNAWAQEYERRQGKNILILNYEDFFIETNRELKRFLDYIKVPANENIIEEAVQYGSVDNMRKMELAGTFNDRRMKPGDKSDQQSYRTRKCKLGSFREELAPEDLAYITAQMKEKLHPMFGYAKDE